jgi:hypothetical protein
VFFRGLVPQEDAVPGAAIGIETIYLDDSESQILSPDSFYAHPDYLLS